ncbi:MAG: EAL domain-containing protein [Terriglobia bacterium]|jgi:diguanylate cyclase (GGDEF)-like protein/PAS domain S-box-containing protein
MFDPKPVLFKFLRLYGIASAITAVGFGCLVLYGWALHIELLKSPIHGLVAMKANTALGLAFCGASLLLLLLPGESHTRCYISRFIAFLVALIGAATLCEYRFHLTLRIDDLLFNDPTGYFGISSAGRMPPSTAMAFLALGLALMLLDWQTRRGDRPAQVLSMGAGLIAMMTIGGYLYHATAIYGLFLYTQVAMPTAIVLLLLSGAVFFARPRSGIAGDLTSEGSGSVMARRFLPAVFCIPILLGWIGLRGFLRGAYGTALGLLLYATATTVAFAVVVWLNARKMNVEHSQRSAAEAGIHKLNAELEGRVAERTKILEQQAAELTEQAALLDLAHDAIVVRDMHHGILSWNRGAEAMYGWLSKEAVGRNSVELLRTEFPEPAENIEAKLRRQGHWEGEAIQHKRDGTRLIVASHWAVQYSADGAPVRILTINNDITDRKQVESKLLLLSERLSLASAVAKVGVWDWDLASNMLTWDATMFDIYGFPLVVPMPYKRWSQAVCPEDLPAVEAALHRVIDEKGQGSVEFRIILSEGSIRNISAIERVVLDEGANVIRVIGVNMDVTERKEAEKALRNSEAQMTHSAQHDFLTGLPNRMLLKGRIIQAIALASRHVNKVAVLFLDLDGFKHINDSLGHPIGDKLLQSIAKRLMDCVRGSDTVSRQGGDEFVVLLAEVQQAEDAAIVVRRMLAAVAEAHLVGQHDIHVSTSIGVSVYPDDGLDAETLIKNADTAMYQAKEDGRQTYRFFKPAMNVRTVERQSIAEGLQRALERKEFVLHYQPKIDLRTGAITGAEALIRWMHPIRGAVPPAHFIPVAEDCGLILPIGDWVLREACKQARAWRDAGLPLPTMAVNISAVQFRDENFLAGVFTMLEDTGLDPGSLELELTESVLMKRAESTQSILKALRARGVRLAVDDFGTGYSSLSYLSKFPIDALKIDASFVRKITTSPEETTIVTAVIDMGRSLKLRVIAEGVETQEELAFLQAHRCDEAQGYYFSPPVPSQQFAKLLATGISEKVLV